MRAPFQVLVLPGNRTALWELHKKLTRMKEKGDIEHEQPISDY
jgi:hypothetical protein